MTRKNKIRTALISTVLIASTSAALLINAQQSNHIIIDGQRVNMQTRPINRNGRLFYPLREVVEHSGATVRWTEHVRVATIFYNNLEIAVQIDNNTMKIGGQSDVQMSVAPFIENGRTFLPLRYVYEAMGYEVSFNEAQGVPIVASGTNQRQNQGGLPSWFDLVLHREVVDYGTVIFTDEGIRQLELEIIRLINIERAKHSPVNRQLVPDAEMMRYARIRSAEARIIFDHVRPCGTPLQFPIENIGNLHGAHHTGINPINELAQRRVDAWLGSFGHRAAMLAPHSWVEAGGAEFAPDLSRIGVGIHQNPAGDMMAVAVFAE